MNVAYHDTPYPGSLKILFQIFICVQVPIVTQPFNFPGKEFVVVSQNFFLLDLSEVIVGARPNKVSNV